MIKIPRSNLFFSLLTTFLILLAYSNSFSNSYHFDDFHVLEKNPYIKDSGNFLKFFAAPYMGSGLYPDTRSYRPLVTASFAFNYTLGGLHVFGYHLVNWVLHTLCAILVYFITLFFLGRQGKETGSNEMEKRVTAFFAALIFGVHPVQTESVTYICGRSSALTAFFFLSAFWAYIEYGRRGVHPYLILSSLAYALALMVKETAITFPVILILFNLFFPLARPWKHRFLSLGPYFILTAAYLLLRMHFFGNLQYGANPIRPLYDHLLTQIRLWVYYIGTLLLPLNLNADYSFPLSHSFLEGAVLQSFFLLVALGLVIWKVSKTCPPVGFFALWFTVNLLPTNSLIPIDDLIADRWLYLSSVGYAVIMALAAFWIFHSWIDGGSRTRKWIFLFCCALVIEFYGYATVMRNFDWTSPWTLWEDTVAKSPNKSRPHTALGLALKEAGRIKEAKGEFMEAIAIAPLDGRPYLNLGLIYDAEGEIDEAITVTQKAVQLTPGLASIGYNNLGLFYLKKGRIEEGLACFQKTIGISSINPSPYFNLANYYFEKGDIDQAIAYMEKAVNLEPENFLAHEALSRFYGKKGWKEKSQAAYRQYMKYSFTGQFRG